MIKSLNGIRAWLFLLIFGAHFKYTIIYTETGKKFFYFFNQARFAILFFILLSGFCMALGYYNKFDILERRNYFNFLKKRLIRIYPLFLISGLIGFIFIYLPQGIEWLYKFILIYIPMLTSWLGITSGCNIAAWFVDVIFFCYILTPFAIHYFSKNTNLDFHIGFCLINYTILVIFSIILVLLRVPYHEYLYRFPPVRVFEYAIALDIGFIFAKMYQQKTFELECFNNYLKKSLIDFMFIILFFCLMYIFPNNLLSRHVIGIPLICIFLLYMCSEKPSILHDIFSSKLLNFLGNISFECYLFHIIILNLAGPHVYKYIQTVPQIIILYITLLSVIITISYIYKQLETLVKNKFFTKIENK